MDEVRGRKRTVNGVTIDTFEYDAEDFNILTAEAGTNGFQDGDSGHGCRTYIRIEDQGGTDIHVKPIRSCGEVSGVEITLGGDSELSTIIEALEFIVETLKEKAEETALRNSFGEYEE